MSTTATSDITITVWDEHIYDQPEVGSKLLRATVHKAVQDEVEGASVAQLLMVRAGAEGGKGYLASERVTARIGERAETFVIQPGGITSGDEVISFGHVVHNTGTADFAGMSGTGASRQDEQGAVFPLDYELASPVPVADPH